MNDQFPPPGWSLRPENWGYWMPGTVFGRLPASWAPPLPPTSSSDTWDQRTPAEPSSDMPSGRGILGQFDSSPAASWPPTSGLTDWNSLPLPTSSAPPAAATSAPSNGSWYQSSPSWVRSAMPLGANVGFSAAPAEPAYQPWTDPVSDKIDRSPWERPPRFVSPPEFIPPVLPMRGPDGWYYPGAQLDPTPPPPPKNFRTRLREALSDDNVRYYAGPHLYDALQKLAPLARLLPGSGTVQSTQDASQAGEEAQAGNYGSAAAHLGMGVVNAGLDWLPPAKLAILAGMGAQTFPWSKLGMAEAMEKAGRPVDEIWQATGLGRAADGSWRFEISSRGYHVNPKAGILDDYGFRIAPLYDHHVYPGLPEAYPGLAGAQSELRIDPAGPTGGHFRPGAIEIRAPTPWTAKFVGIHELQHMVDHLEGHARGGHPAEFFRPGISRQEAVDQYRKLAGEVAARNTQSRLYLTEQERLRKAPQTTEDIPRDQQIIRFYRPRY
jgi:hypothetical protein